MICFILIFAYLEGHLKPESEKSRKISMSEMNLEDFDGLLKKYIEKNQQWKRLCLLLDYDGTLAPVASHPDLTILPDETKAVLERLSKLPDVFMGIITGRSIPDIKQKVGIPGITYAGNHGLDIVHPDGTKVKIFLGKNRQNPNIGDFAQILGKIYRLQLTLSHFHSKVYVTNA